MRKGASKTIEEDVEIFDEALALSSVGGDPEFLCEMVGLIQAALPTLLANIKEGIARGDLRAVGKSARLAKAAARNVSGKRAFESALRLETLVGQGNLPGARRVSADLEREAKQLQLALAKLRNSRCAAPC